MSVIIFSFILLFVSITAGLLGSLTGLGGGVVLIPVLTLVFKVDIHYAIGTSLISVIATSSGAAAAYVKEGITNIRLGMFLELATTIGAIMGAVLAKYVSTSGIAIVFGVMLLISALTSFIQHDGKIDSRSPSRLSTWLQLNNTY